MLAVKDGVCISVSASYLHGSLDNVCRKGCGPSVGEVDNYPVGA